jgi:hypothetical protein
MSYSLLLYNWRNQLSLQNGGFYIIQNLLLHNLLRFVRCGTNMWQQENIRIISEGFSDSRLVVINV